jgi:predicted rRNA methylase YqxC with S4 and FtsJ domains
MIGIFNNYNKMCDQLEQTFKDVSKSPIAQDEEGNVLYFIKISKDTQE